MNHDGLEKYLFQTNIPPPEIDYTRARELLRLEEKLQLIDSLVEDLVQCRNQIYNRLHSYKNIVSATRRFPPEIVAPIFRCSVVLESTREAPSSDTAPLLLTQICSAWKQIAFRTQELWNHVPIQVDLSSSKHSLSAQISLAKIWMRRCRALPYTLTLIIPSEIISTQSTTLGKLVLLLPYDHLQPMRTLLAGMTFPMLHTLIIYPNPQYNIVEVLIRLQLVERLLHKAIYDVLGLCVPWHQLTNLKLDRFHCCSSRTQPEKMLAVLEKSSCLRSCAVALDDIEFESSRIVGLPHLERLDVTFTAVECVAALQRRSQFDLQQLAISGLNITDTADILSFFALVPNLQSICLTFMRCVDVELIAALTYDNDREHLLPKLTEMTFTVYPDDEDGITDYLEKMICSRMRSDEETSGNGIKNRGPVAVLKNLRLGVGSAAHFTEEVTRLEVFVFKELRLSIMEAPSFLRQLLDIPESDSE